MANCEVFYDNAKTMSKNKYYSKESHLTNHVCMKLIANTSLRLIYSICYEIHYVDNRHCDGCYHTLGVFSKLVPRAGITVVYRCISQPSLIPVLDTKKIIN